MVLRSEAFGFAFFKTMQSKLASNWRSSCLHSSGAGITDMHSHTFRKSLNLDENIMVELTGSVSLSQEKETTVPCLTLSAPGSRTSCPPILRIKSFKLPSLWVIWCNSPKREQQLPVSTPLKPKVKVLWPLQQPAPTCLMGSLSPFASGGQSDLSPPVGSSQHSFRGDNPQLMAITVIPTSTGYPHQIIQTFPFFYVTGLGLTLRHQMGRSDINDATSWLYDLRQLEPSAPSFLPVKWQWWSYFIWVYGN